MAAWVDNLAFQEPDINPGLFIVPPVVLCKSHILIKFKHLLNGGLYENRNLIFFRKSKQMIPDIGQAAQTFVIGNTSQDPDINIVIIIGAQAGNIFFPFQGW